jgi:hypothetical protein
MDSVVDVEVYHVSLMTITERQLPVYQRPNGLEPSCLTLTISRGLRYVPSLRVAVNGPPAYRSQQLAKQSFYPGAQICLFISIDLL